MLDTMPGLEDDHELAAELARTAGEQLVELRRDLIAQHTPPSELRNRGDESSHLWLTSALERLAPTDGILSEEAPRACEHRTDQHVPDRLWIIDPLDGTREFGEQRADWAVHVALSLGGRPLVGAVALPTSDDLYCTGSPVVVPPPPSTLRVVMSRTRHQPEALAVASEMGAEVVKMGSAGAKAMSIVRGETDIYIHSGGMYAWDSCAPVAVARACGLRCSRLDGSDLLYDQPSPWIPDLLICRHEHYDRVIEAVRTART